MSLSIKKGDNVLVIAGKDKGKTGKVLSVNPDAGNVKVEGVNIVTKHSKPRGAQNPGGRNKAPGNIDVSNVQLVCPSCNKATRIKAGEAEGKKVRVCTHCGANLDDRAKTDAKKKKVTAKKDTAAKRKSKKDEATESVDTASGSKE